MSEAQVEEFLDQCKLSSDKAYCALKGVLEKLQDVGTRAEARRFLASLQKFVDKLPDVSDNLSVFHFSIHQLSLAGYKGFPKERQSLTLLELPSVFVPEDWSFTLFEGINRLPDSAFKDRNVAELGCGNGWICLAVAEKWSPRKVYGLDINPRAIKVSWINLYLNAYDEEGSAILDHEGRTLLDKVEFHESDLLAYCTNNKISLDRIIGCLPQVLNPDPHAMPKIVSENANDDFLYSLTHYVGLQGLVEDEFGLGLIARAAEEAIFLLNPFGTMILNLGGRIGQAICEQLFERRGFHISKLWKKRVNQNADTADNDILAMMEIENNSDYRFEFFMGLVSEELISARTAWAHVKAGGRISHQLSVYSCQLQQPNQIKTIFEFLKGCPQDIRDGLDLSFKDESVAEEKIFFLAHLAHALEESSHIPHDLPVGNTRFQNHIAGFMRLYHSIPIGQDNLIVFPSRSVAIEHFMYLFSPELALVDGSLTKFIPRNWLSAMPAKHSANGPIQNLCGSNIAVIETPKQVDMIMQLLHNLKPQVAVVSLAEFEMKSSLAFEQLLGACAEVGSRLLLDISDYIEISSQPATNGVLQYLATHALPLHVTVVCGLVKNKVYSDLEIAFIISENQDVLRSMSKMKELLNGRTQISNQFYYGCLLHELLAFQIPGRDTLVERPLLKEKESKFIPVPQVMSQCLKETELTTQEHRLSDVIHMDSNENLLPAPSVVRMTVFEGFSRQNITDIQMDPIPEIWTFVSTKWGIPAISSSKIILSDTVMVLFSKLVLSCIENDGTLLFPAGSMQKYVYAAKLLGSNVKIIQTSADDSFKLTEKVLTDYLASTHKPWLYISGPTIYPTGLVYSDTEIKGLISACQKHSAHLILDTSFSGLEYGIHEPTTWNLKGFNCSSVAVIGSFSSVLLTGGLEFCFAVLQEDLMSAFRDSSNLRIPHGTLKYTIKKLLNIYNEKDTSLHAFLNGQQKVLHQRACLLSQVLQNCGWDPLQPLGGMSMIARPAEYEGKFVSLEGYGGSTTELKLDSNNIQKAISDITGLCITNSSWTCIPGYCQFGFALEEKDFEKAIKALERFKETALTS